MTEIGRIITHKTTHQDGGADEIDATGLTGRCDFVDRGDPTAFDFSGSDFTTDETWRDLSLSTIIPVGTRAVLLSVQIRNDTLPAELLFRKKGNVNTVAISAISAQVANIYFYQDIWVPVSSERKIQYWATNTAFDGIYVSVRGWLF